MHALRRLGEVRLRPIEAEHVRTEVYAAARPISTVSTVSAGEWSRRYQAFKIAIEPVKACSMQRIIIPLSEPMPTLF